MRPELADLRETLSFDGWADLLASGSAQQRLPVVRPGDPAQIQYRRSVVSVVLAMVGCCG